MFTVMFFYAAYEMEGHFSTKYEHHIKSACHQQLTATLNIAAMNTAEPVTSQTYEIRERSPILARLLNIVNLVHKYAVYLSR